MELIQHGYECDFELNIFINIFFDRSENGTITTYFSHENDVINVVTEIDFCGEIYKSDYSYGFENSVSDKALIKKIYGCTCCKSFVEAAKKIRNIELPWGVMSGIRPAKSVRQLFDSGKDRAEVKAYLKDVYNISDKKCELAITVSENEKEILERVKDNSVSLYIGIPFCPSRCLYCSFVSTDIKNSGKYMDEFSGLLCREIEKTREILDRLGFYVQNIYIGGGTPTTLSEQNLERVLKSISDNINLPLVEEFTLEAGRPDTITPEKMKIAKAMGVDRISINPQTLNQKTLEIIGRKHTVEEFYRAFEMARAAGFNNINTDIIAGLPGENFEMFKASVDGICRLNPENVTIHSMCIKRAAALRFSDVELTGYSEMNRMIDYGAASLEAIGKEPYYMYRQKNISGNLENVGYSSKKFMSSYNINIMEEVQTIIALGGGGSSKVVMGDRIERVVNFKEPYEYIKRFDEILAKKEEIYEYLK